MRAFDTAFFTLGVVTVLVATLAVGVAIGRRVERRQQAALEHVDPPHGSSQEITNQSEPLLRGHRRHVLVERCKYVLE